MRNRYICRNPNCMEVLGWRNAGGLCPSCRWAFGRGMLLAGVAGFVIGLVRHFL